MKTYGELWYEQKQDIDLSQENYKKTRGLPPRMKHIDAVKYYNKKLFAYWLDKLDDDISIPRKRKIINLYMFGLGDKHKLFKEH